MLKIKFVNFKINNKKNLNKPKRSLKKSPKYKADADS